MSDVGHNSEHRGAVQWQTPHLPHDHRHEEPESSEEPDVDLVESAFHKGFETASDLTSFLRLARVPFVSERDGRRLELLQVRIENTVDVASVTRGIGGGHRTEPLPATLVSRRERLRFVYLANDERLELTLAEVRDLPDLTPTGSGSKP